MSYKLSVLVPSIRTGNLIRLYESIKGSFSKEFEMIVASPYELPPPLAILPNVKWIKTFRSPIAAQQEALIHSTGKWVSWAADDGIYLPNCLDESFELLQGKDYKTIIVSKYHEGDNQQGMDDDKYYLLHTHDTMRLMGVPMPCLLLNCGLVSRQLLMELGGWEASRFQACPISYNDFSIRAFKYGANWILQDKPVFKCSHEPGMTGTHGPIHIAQTQHDQPIFSGIYSNINDRMVIDIDNWKQSDEVWTIRFGEVGMLRAEVREG
jgi:hypothetical protein